MTRKPKPLFQFNLFGLAFYYVMLFTMFGVFMKRADTGFWQHVPFIAEHALNSHFSNFSLSFILIWGVGLASLLFSRSWKFIFGWAGLLILANLVTELWITAGNTTDFTDALAGIIGSCLALSMLWLLSRYGLRHHRPDADLSQKHVAEPRERRD